MDNVLLQRSQDDITVFFLAQGEQNGIDVAQRLADFIAGAQQSIDIAVYDFRLNGQLHEIVVEALKERASAGVQIRIAYDSDKPDTPNLAGGQDPAPSGTGAFVQSLGFPWRRIGGLKLMHNKYLVRDAATSAAQVWTGSTNLTDDAFTQMENNIIILKSSQLCSYYEHDFEDLWRSGQIENTGSFDTQPVYLSYGGNQTTVSLMFSPGRGESIDYKVAERVANARNRVLICSMLINSSALISALTDTLCFKKLQVTGIYDRTQMESVIQQWQNVPHNRWKIPAVQDIIEATNLVGKNSTPYSPNTVHDFMHNKVLVVDDTVITGSYNFSRSAELNSENILIIDNAQLASQYAQYIQHLMQKYGS